MTKSEIHNTYIPIYERTKIVKSCKIEDPFHNSYNRDQHNQPQIFEIPAKRFAPISKQEVSI